MSFYENEYVRADAAGAADEACSADDSVDGDTPTAADCLQEKIEQELSSNPVLEQIEPEAESEETTSDTDAARKSKSRSRLRMIITRSKISSGSTTWIPTTRITIIVPSLCGHGAMTANRIKNSRQCRIRRPGRNHSTNILTEQWRLIEARARVKAAGSMIIDYIDDRGYLTVRLEQLYNKDKPQITLEHLQRALDLVQRLEPAGVGARDIKECLLIQMAQSGEDMSFEEQLVWEHLDELLENRLPDIARKMNCSVEQINKAIAALSKLDTSPGLLIGRNENHPIMADVIIEPDEHGGYDVRLTDTRLPSLRVNNFYAKMSRDKSLDEKTREFLQKNMRSASG